MNSRLDFFRDESGAVTVDFTVITAGVVGLGLASVGAISTGQNTLTLNAADIVGNNKVEVYCGGTLVSTVEAGRDMSEYRFEITAGMGDGSDTLMLAESGTRDNTGTYVTDIRVY